MCHEFWYVLYIIITTYGVGTIVIPIYKFGN